MSGVVHSLPLGSKQEIAKLPLIGTELFTPLMGGVGTMFEIVPIFCYRDRVNRVTNNLFGNSDGVLV